MLLRTHHVILCKLHMVSMYQPSKIRWQTSFQAWNILFDLLTFWDAPDEIFLGYENDFVYNAILNNTEFTFIEKNQNFFLFSLLNDPRR